MRRILKVKEYERLLLSLSDDERRQAAEAIVSAARELMNRFGLLHAVFLCAGPLREVGILAAEQLCSLIVFMNRDELPDLTGSVVCDLLLSSRVDDAWSKAVNDAGCPVLSVGVPAGVEPDTGRACNTAMKAQITVAPFAYLPGSFLHEGLDRCGKIRPVGAEAEKYDGLARFEWSDAKRFLPPRRRTAHKGDSGKALLCVGSPKYTGAALLCARACLAAGCGILFVACPNLVRTALNRLPEAIGVPVGEDWNDESCAAAIRALEGMQALGLGCGVGNGDVSPLIRAALRSKLPMVLDADGLNCLSRHPELYPLLHEEIILTPHPGEMSRLTGLPVGKVLDDPVAAAEKYARAWGCIVLLKGAATVVSDGMRTRLVAEGNAGLAKGGSGDVLTGIITGLLSQGVEPCTAACLGSFLLGTSADRAFNLLRERMLRSSNVIEALEVWDE